MIKLTDDLIFAEGGRRYCFVHPDDPGKCIKTLSPNGDPLKRKKEAIWYKKPRPLSMFDDNARELKSFQDLAKMGEAVWANGLRKPDNPLHQHYAKIKELGLIEEICDYCAEAFDVKDNLPELQRKLLTGDYEGHPGLVAWIKKGYQIVSL